MAAPASPLIVAGLGNLLLQDDGIGVRLVRELEKRSLPAEVRLLEIGTAIFTLPPPPGEGWRLLLVDAMAAGGAPGSVYMLPAGELLQLKQHTGQALSLHDLRAAGLLLLPGSGWNSSRCYFFGVEPAEMGCGCALSPCLENKLPLLTETLLRAAIYSTILGQGDRSLVPE